MTGETDLKPGLILLGWIRDELARTPLFLGEGLDEPLPVIDDLSLDGSVHGIVVQWPCPYHHIRAHCLVTAAPHQEALRVDVYSPASTPWSPDRIGVHAFTDPDGSTAGMWGAYWYVKENLLAVR